MKSRILFEQMLGRGTRQGEKFPDKSHFVVVDCFDGTLLHYFKNATAVTSEPPETPGRTIAQVIADIWANRDRDYNVRCLVKRLHRIDKEMDGSARDLFAAHGIADGDLAKYAAALPDRLRADFTGSMALLRNPAFQQLLTDYPPKPKTFLKAIENRDEVSSEYLVRDAAGKEYKPGDYLEAFARFVCERAAEIDAISILLGRPRDWSTAAQAELRAKLTAAAERFTEDALQRVHHAQYRKALVDIISMVKHAANAEAPLLTAAERVGQALDRLTAGREFTPAQADWLERIRAHLTANLTIERDDFDFVPVLHDAGGWGAAARAFPDLPGLIARANASNRRENRGECVRGTRCSRRP